MDARCSIIIIVEKRTEEHTVNSVTIQKLTDNVSKLSPRDQNFATSLIRAYNKKGSLSPKQEPWVQTLIDRAEGTTQPQKTEQVGSMSGLIDIFTKAKKHLKYPGITLQVKEQVVRMSMGLRGKGAGQLNVTDGKPFGENRWYGRVSVEGTWTQGRQYPETPEVRQLLLDMSSNPVATAQAHGRLTGKCCFCNHGLKDEKSTSVGYGPTCAEHFGLPWGNKRRGS